MRRNWEERKKEERSWKENDLCICLVEKKKREEKKLRRKKYCTVQYDIFTPKLERNWAEFVICPIAPFRAAPGAASRSSHYCILLRIKL